MKKILSYSCVFLAMITEWSSLAAETQYIECTIERLDRSSIHPGGVDPFVQIDESSGKSTNWSGYAAVNDLQNPATGSVSGVTGKWIVPALLPTSDDTYSSIWVGIDGLKSHTVEQLGTLHEWKNGQQINSAWFEMYPLGSFHIQGFPVEIGDHCGASVHYIGNNTFEMTMYNYTKGVHTVVPTANTMSSATLRNSAEWIVEAPSRNGTLPLADFGTVTFTECTTTINNVPGTISNSHWQFEQITMVTSGGIIKALPSNLMNYGYRFSVTWGHE